MVPLEHGTMFWGGGDGAGPGGGGWCSPYGPGGMTWGGGWDSPKSLGPRKSREGGREEERARMTEQGMKDRKRAGSKAEEQQSYGDEQLLPWSPGAKNGEEEEESAQGSHTREEGVPPLLTRITCGIVFRDMQWEGAFARNKCLFSNYTPLTVTQTFCLALRTALPCFALRTVLVLALKTFLSNLPLSYAWTFA